MKKYIFLILAAAVFYVNCATVQKKEKSSLGNFPPKRLGSVSASTVKRGGKELLPREYSFVIIPENNKLRMHHKLLGDNIWIFFSGENRKLLVSAIEEYLKVYKTELKGAPSKAYFGKAETEMIWGVLNAAHTAKPVVRFEYAHLKNGRPYFIMANKTVKSEKDGANCPAIRAAFSPAQCRKVLKLIGEENISSVIREMKIAFEEYDEEDKEFDDDTMSKEAETGENGSAAGKDEDFDE